MSNIDSIIALAEKKRKAKSDSDNENMPALKKANLAPKPTVDPSDLKGMRDAVHKNPKWLRDMSRLLDYPNKEKGEKGWEELAEELGLSLSQIQYYKRRESPTSDLIIYWLDGKDATFAKFKIALSEIKRPDAIDLVNRLK